MFNFSADKKWDREKASLLLIFCCVTFIMLATRYAGFYTFRGSDDLHYAFLSSKVLNGNYDMFFAQDIYAGRSVIVLYQALWFKLFGINNFTMCMPSLSVLITLAYVVCFKCGLQKNIRTIILAGSLIYFNPVVTRTTLGNLPDVYIALIALLVFLFIKKSTATLSSKQGVSSGIAAGLLLIAGLFVKETIVLIYAGTAVTLFYYRKNLSRHFIITLAAIVCAGIAAYLFFYYANTGNAFFRFVQIKNAAFFNSCSYGCLPGADFLKRLTITIPLQAVVSSAWPLLLVVPAFAIYRRQKNIDTGFWKVAFLSLLILALYFPFSIAPYIPLCHDMRQFFFLFPFAAVFFVMGFGNAELTEKQTKTINISGSIVFVSATLLCLFLTPYNKWSILCGGLLAFVFIVSIFSKRKIQDVGLYLALPFVMWLSTAYTVFKKPHQAYPDLKNMQHKVNQHAKFYPETYYFLSNDTKTHVALINRFDTAERFIDLDTIQKQFKPFIAYQPKNLLNGTDSIQKGWLIVSEPYLENMTAAQIQSIRILLAQQPYVYKINQTSAYWIGSGEILKKIMNIVNQHDFDSGCY